MSNAPTSEVLLRQIERFQGRVLLAGLPAVALLGDLPQAHAWGWDAGGCQQRADGTGHRPQQGGRCHGSTAGHQDAAARQRRGGRRTIRVEEVPPRDGGRAPERDGHRQQLRPRERQRHAAVLGRRQRTR